MGNQNRIARQHTTPWARWAERSSEYVLVMANSHLAWVLLCCLELQSMLKQMDDDTVKLIFVTTSTRCSCNVRH
jgi:hypothetical protein